MSAETAASESHKVDISMRQVNKIIIHCSATVEGRDYTVEQIRDWHVKGNGWKDIGYHFVIYRDGTVHTGRDINQIGAHTTGQNTGSIGICYVGGLAADGKTPKDTRTDAQKKALRALVDRLCQQYGINRRQVYGHNEFAAKACPCFDVKKEFRV